MEYLLHILVITGIYIILTLSLNLILGYTGLPAIMLASGRALMLKPKLLLADEPSLGLSPNYMDLIFEKLAEINKVGTSILLVEQNAQMALEISHRGYVFKIGEIVLEDKSRNLLEHDGVKKAFFGVS
jgi:branched-chain amino acid transport system ATP-binding protein